MKILFDTVYTGRPSTCSTSYLVWSLIEQLIETRDDVFFYLLVPQKYIEDEKEQEYLNRHVDRVTLIAKTCNHFDRLGELFEYDRELAVLTSAYSQCWDADVIVTSRVPQVAAYKAHYNRILGKKLEGWRRVYCLEEMPILSFRDTIPWGEKFEIQTLASYLISDGIMVNNLWTHKNMMKSAKRLLSPALQKQLSAKVHEVVPVRLERMNLDAKPRYSGKGDFYVGFTGRVTGTRNMKEVAELFRKHHSYPLGKSNRKVKFVISTNSLSTGSSNFGDLSFIDMEHNNREEFHDFLRNRVHVVVNLSTVEDFSLSTYEPLNLGVPVIVPNREWAGFLGDDYPFRVSGMTETYGMVKEFINKYSAQYKKFKKWEQTTWIDLVDSPRNRSTFDVLEKLLAQFEEDKASYLDNTQSISYDALLADALASTSKEIDIEEIIRRHGYSAGIDLKKMPIMKRPGHLMFKAILLRNGFVDTNVPCIMERL